MAGEGTAARLQCNTVDVVAVESAVLVELRHWDAGMGKPGSCSGRLERTVCRHGERMSRAVAPGSADGYRTMKECGCMCADTMKE